MKTPIGLLGLSSLARLVSIRLAIIASPWRLADDAAVEDFRQAQNVSISSRTMRPTGMPVQSDTTEATDCSSTWA